MFEYFKSVILLIFLRHWRVSKCHSVLKNTFIKVFKFNNHLKAGFAKSIIIIYFFAIKYSDVIIF